MYRNSEHYPDPTAGIALARIAREERIARKRAKVVPAKEPVRKKPLTVSTAVTWRRAWTEGRSSSSTIRR